MADQERLARQRIRLERGEERHGFGGIIDAL
jgi:hypothetical protein